MTTATAPTARLDAPQATRRVAITWVAQMTDRNGSTMFSSLTGGLTRNIEEAETFVTRAMAELYADPAFSGIPARNIARLEIRGEAVPVEWA